MEESQRGLPRGDAAYIAYSNKFKVLRVESEGKGAQCPGGREPGKFKDAQGSPQNHAWKQLDTLICSSGWGLWVDISEVLAHKYHSWQMPFLGSASWRF